MGIEELSEREKLETFVALENPLRYNMLIFLENQGGRAKHYDIAKEFKLVGNEYVHHINLLLKYGLVKTTPDSYVIENVMDSSVEIGRLGRIALENVKD